MGEFWLHDLPEILAPGIGRGIQEIELIDDWELRSRSSGGLESIDGLLKHHTASPESWDWDKDISYLAGIPPIPNPYAPSPVSQIYHSREGKIAIIAAGAANHGGRGGAYHPDGPFYVGINLANYRLIGDEMGNDGVGEQWPWQQIEASITSDALICLAEKWGPGHAFAHKEYCGPGTTQPGRKIDPYGPWENHPHGRWPDESSWGGYQSTINAYRDLVATKMFELSQEVNVMHGFVPRPDTIDERILDTRGPTGPGHDTYKVPAKRPVAVNVPGGAGKTSAIINITVAEGDGPGFLTVWDGGDMPTSSKLNWLPGQTIPNEVTVPLAADGTFYIYALSRVHVFMDLVGYYQRMT